MKRTIYMAVVGLILTLFWVLFIATIVSAQQEEITLSTYYPAPYGEYDELCAEKLLVDTPSAAELDDMQEGDCHITRSLIVGTAAGGFSYDALNAAVPPTPLYDGDVIIEGSVGIGTTVPTNTFTLKSGSGTLAGGRIMPATTNTGGIYLQTTDEAQFLLMGGMEYGLGSQFYARSTNAAMVSLNGFGAQTGIEFSYDTGLTAGNLFSPTRRMVIQPDGNVGIGTTGPGSKFVVEGESTSGVPLAFVNNGSNTTALSNGLRIIGGGDSSGAYILQGQQDNGTVAFSFRGNGNVGIGTTSPSEKLEVAGNIGLTGNIVKTGTVANVVMVQTRAQALYSAPTSGNGTAITPLNLVITPKKAGNRIILEWIVGGEMFHDTVYIVTRNGVLLADTTNAANNRWAGITAQPYGADSASTPDNAVVKIIDMNSLDVATTYELRVRSSSGGTYTLYLNRTVGGTGGQDAYEACLSVGTATEIWW